MIGGENNLYLTKVEEKGVCRCNTCNEVFNQSLIKRVHREHLGQTRNDVECPNCGSVNFGLIDQLVDEEYNTYKNNDFWRAVNSKIDNIRRYNVFDFIYAEEE